METHELGTRRPGWLLACATAGALLVLACSVSPDPGPSGSGSSGDGNGTFEAELSLCLNETNRLRATIGKAALTRSTELEAYAAKAVQADAASGTAHQYARQTNFGNGLARAETEALGWNLSYYGSVTSVVTRSIGQMWGQGPGGEHYDILSGGYTQIGCGIFVEAGNVSMAQAFR